MPVHSGPGRADWADVESRRSKRERPPPPPGGRHAGRTGSGKEKEGGRPARADRPGPVVLGSVQRGNLATAVCVCVL
jgi:hypothetical protein